VTLIRGAALSTPVTELAISAYHRLFQTGTRRGTVSGAPRA
jgi:hypothetical protein